MKIRACSFILLLALTSCGQKNSNNPIDTIITRSTQTPEHPVDIEFSESDSKKKINVFANSVHLNLFQISKQYFYGVDLNQQESFKLSVINPLREKELVHVVNEQLKRITSFKLKKLSEVEKIDLLILEDYIVNQRDLRVIQLKNHKVDIGHNIYAPFYFLNSIQEISEEKKKKSFGDQLVHDLSTSKYFVAIIQELTKMNTIKNLKISDADLEVVNDIIKQKEGYALHLEQALEKISSNNIGIKLIKDQFLESLALLSTFLEKRESLNLNNSNSMTKEEYQATLRIHGVYANADEMYKLAKSSLELESNKMNKLIEKVRTDLNLPNFTKLELFKYFRDHRSAKSNEDLKETIDKINDDISVLINQEQIITQPKEPSLVLFAGLESGELGDILKGRSSHGIPQMIDSLPPFMNAPFALWADIEVMKTKASDFIIKDTLHSITAHEGRPGHEMQFRTIRGMKEKSLIRHSMIQNTANVEGWALFAESLIEKHINNNTTRLFYKLNYLLRIVRVITDYEISLGLISRSEGVEKYKQLLGVEESTAVSEINRRINSPGRDTGYFMGRTALENLRVKLKAKHPGFKPLCFNNLVLGFSFSPAKYIEQLIEKVPNCLKSDL